MNGALYYIAWKNSTGGYTLSERYSSARQEPTIAGPQDATIIPFARSNGLANANIGFSFTRPLYSVSNQVAYGPIAVGSATNFLWATGSQVTGSVDSVSSSFSQHGESTCGTFSIDFSATSQVSVGSGGGGPRSKSFYSSKFCVINIAISTPWSTLVPTPPSPSAGNTTKYCVSGTTFCVSAVASGSGYIFTIETSYTGYVSLGGFSLCDT